MDTPITAAAASAFTQTQVGNQVGTAVAVKTLNVQRQAGAGMLRLLDAAVGRASTAGVNGLGRHVDVVG